MSRHLRAGESLAARLPTLPAALDADTSEDERADECRNRSRSDRRLCATLRSRRIQPSRPALEVAAALRRAQRVRSRHLRSRAVAISATGDGNPFVLTFSEAFVGGVDVAWAAGAVLDSRSDDGADDVSQATGSGIDHDGNSTSTAGTHRQHTIVVASTQCRIAAERLRSMTVAVSAASVRRAILIVTLIRRVIAACPFVPSARIRRSVPGR